MARLPFVSVIIPTFNRSDMLRRTVETFLSQSYDPGRLEVILVDNNSTDDTPQVISGLAREHALIRTLFEARRGAHFARNSGARAARGEILYFTDDDMLAEPGLLKEIVAAFGSESVGAATGRILPEWEVRPPEWVLEHCQNELMSLNDRGAATFITDSDPGVYSCHQAVARDVFFRAGGFNPDTNAGMFVGDNETGLNIKIRNLGYRFAYVGASVTRHMIPARRMSQRYLNSRLADQGLCDSYTAYRAAVPGRPALTVAMLRNTLLLLPTAAAAAARFGAGRSSWRLTLARLFYLRNRVKYDFRLFRSQEWRRFALRDDWVTE